MVLMLRFSKVYIPVWRVPTTHSPMNILHWSHGVAETGGNQTVLKTVVQCATANVICLVHCKVY